MERIFKYHGIGNDFVVLDRRASGRDIDSDTARALCDRRLGVGADGVLVLLPPSGPAAAKMVVHNADGTLAEMCGNGIRCAAKYLADRTQPKAGTLLIETGAGELSCDVAYDGAEASHITVSMGAPRLVAANLPSAVRGQPFVREPLPDFPDVRGTAVSMGNPHLVLFERPLVEAKTLGPKLEHSTAFPERTNVEFVEKTSDGFKVVVWERGTGLTEACGTGACAVVVAASLEGRRVAGGWVPVELPGGRLDIRVALDLSDVRMRGPAVFVFDAVVPGLAG